MLKIFQNLLKTDVSNISKSYFRFALIKRYLHTYKLFHLVYNRSTKEITHTSSYETNYDEISSKQMKNTSTFLILSFQH